MTEICQWCSNTSAAIDSLEDQVEQLEKQRDEMMQIINGFVTELCEREGAEDYPVEAEDQSCQAVRKAMLFIQRIED